MPNPTEDKYKDFLDELRESSKVNMFGAVPHLQREFPWLTNREAKDILHKWMESFGK